MGFFKRLIANIYLDKNHKDALNELAYIIKDCKTVSSVYECRNMRDRIMVFMRDRLDGDKHDGIRKLCADLIEYLADTCYHAEHLYHKPRHNGWKTVRVFPNINDYLDIGKEI